VNEPTNGSLPYRVAALERRVEEIEAVKPDVLAHVVSELHDEVMALRRALVGFALTVAASAIVFAFTVFEILRV
jgi:hypothetical protein